MTAQEAIEILRNAAWLGSDADRERTEEAVKMAINALEAQEQLANNSPKLDSKFGELINNKRTDKRTETHACDYIIRRAAIDACTKAKVGAFPYDAGVNNSIKALKALPSAHPEAKPIDYRDCADAMLMMWMWNVLTDGEYYRIMDKLNKHEAERRNDD